MLEILKQNFPNSVFHFVGSRVCVDPPPLDSDCDVLVNEAPGMLEFLAQNGFMYEGGEDYETADFNSFRKGELNLLVSYSLEFTEKFLFATQVCKKLNLKNKDDRITVFEAILYNTCK